MSNQQFDIKLINEVRTAVNWMDRQDVVSYLENQAGFAVYDNEDVQELKETLILAVLEGDVILEN